MLHKSCQTEASCDTGYNYFCFNRNFVNNTDLNEENSLTHLIEQLDPIHEGEVNPMQHSNYYNNEEFMGAPRQIDGKLSILNFNCQCLNSKLIKLKYF